MTASNPLIPKIIKLTFAGTSFAEDVIDAKLVPVDPERTSVITLDGVAHVNVGTASWNFVVNMVLDDDSVRPGLAYYLNNNVGTTVAVVFNPHTSGSEAATAPAYNFSVAIVPVQRGGDGNVYAEYEVTLPVTGVITRDATP